MAISEECKFTTEGLKLMEKRGSIVLDKSTVCDGDLFEFLMAEDGGWRFTDFVRIHKLDVPRDDNGLIDIAKVNWAYKIQFTEQYMGGLSDPDKPSWEYLLDYIRHCTLSPNVPGYNYAVDKYFIVYKPKDILIQQVMR